MLKRLFIPIVLLLVVTAALVFWFRGDHAPRDIRHAVPVEHFTLNNGLTVVVMPNDRIEAVTQLLVVKAGAGDDPYGKSGLAHYLEHLMFTGTKSYPEGEYDRRIARVGGEQNAYTVADFTLYYATVATEQLPMLMAMEADRFQHIEITPEHAARELKVITEERNLRVDNRAETQLNEQLDALTFLNHPYHHPTIGWAEDMATFTPADAQAFFTQYYRAGNMVLVLAGDITAREARRYAQQYFGEMPAGAAPARVWPKEPPLRLKRRGAMQDAKAHQSRLVRQYVAPSLGAADAATTPALQLYAQALGGGTTSLLYDALVRQQKLASNVSAGYDPLNVGPSLLRIDAVPAAGVSLTQLEAALDAVLASSLATPLDEATLARAKTQLKAQTIFAQDGLQPLAHLIGELYALGQNEQYFYDWASRIEQVSASQIQAAAKAVVQENYSVTGTLEPAIAPATEAPHAP
ncbi:MAG: M16 family metallopeptidase [Rickettsiales bacterium]